jgi:arginyl-tRNA--protein-N-Asp/Glu arginylyltransferase
MSAASNRHRLAKTVNYRMTELLKFYQDTPHSCSYMDDRQAQNIYPDPNVPMTNSMYSLLITHGFRRSGDMAYRPYCPSCQDCVPVRINVEQFKPNRSQRRCLKRNEDLTVSIHDAEFNPEHYQLYCLYLTTRHVGGGMDEPTKESYLRFLTSEWSETKFIEIRQAEKLVAVAVTDYIDEGLSALYTFFDPTLAHRSLGTFGILTQINLAQSLGLPWLYLGYWIKDCQKMQYKQNFSAVESYKDQQWLPLKT